MFSPKMNNLTIMALALMIAMPALASASAGKAIFVIGKVSVLPDNGAEYRIRRGNEVNQGDTIVTNERSQVQLRMNDGTLLAVRPNSRFRIDDYQYEQDVDTDRSYYSLMKGGMRSITGAIGKEDKSSYGVNTLVGTIGIRGTDFSARLCDSDCANADDGLYVGVMDGAVVISNDSGELDVYPGDFGYLQDSITEPGYLEGSPGDLLFAQTDTDTQSVEVVDSTENSTSGSESLSETDSTISATDNSAVALSTTSENGDDLIAITDEDLLEPTNVGLTEEEILDPVITDPIDTGIALPSSGTAIYQVVSSTSPTDGVTTGTLDTTTTYLNVNFVDTSATANISASINNSDWDGTTTQAMAINNDGSFNGDLYVSVSDPMGFGSTQTGSGSLTGSLSGSAEPTIGAPSDANMSYDMSTGSNTISGDITLGVSDTAP